MNITIREPGSAITHYIAMMLSLTAATPLLVKATKSGSLQIVVSLAIFILSMILLYGASTLYHSVNVGAKALKIFQKIDHMMIFVLIAGSYTPVCLIVLKDNKGYQLLSIVWALALAGFLMNIFWINCPKWVSSVVYIAMGWVCVGVFSPLHRLLSRPAFLWLLAGGIIYTLGGIVYAMNVPVFHGRFKYFGIHELFHLFVMGGSICHFIFMYYYIA